MAFVAGLRYALRSYVRSPALASTLVVTIAAGIGSNAAIFAFIGGLISREIGGADPEAAGRFLRMAVLLTLASALVLALACSSVAGLLLSRASGRAKETAVRIALGASRRGLALLFLADISVVVLAGGLIGIVLASWTASLVPLLFFVEDAEALAMAPDLQWLGVAAGVWTCVLMACGMAPLLTVSHRDPSVVLRRDAAGLPPSLMRLRRRLVIGQIAACVVLMAVAGVVRDDLRSALRTSRGEALGGLLVAPVETGPRSDLGRAYLDAVATGVRALDGVTGTAWMTTIPGGRMPSRTFAVEPPVARSRALTLDVSTLVPADLPKEWLTPVAGRMFRGGDRPGACLVALINEAAADRYFDGDAVGASIDHADGRPVEIVGVIRSAGEAGRRRPALYYFANQVPLPDVVRDEVWYAQPRRTRQRDVSTRLDIAQASAEYFHVFADPPLAGRVFDEGDDQGACAVGVIGEEAARDFFGGQAVGGALVDAFGGRVRIIGVVGAQAIGVAERAAPPLLLRSLAQSYEPKVTLAIRTTRTSDEDLTGVGAAIDAIEGGRPRGPVMTLDEHLMRTSLAAARVSTALVTVCAALALVLSLAGIQGAMADHVTRRRRELALRIALGAGARRLVAQVVREGARLAVTGAGAGIVLALAATPLVAQFVLRPRLPSAITLAAALMATVLIVALACAVPAWRAVRVDPRSVLQEQ